MKLNKLINVSLCLMMLLNLGCFEDDGPSPLPTDCGALAIIDGFSYQNAVTSPYTITSAVINEDCLVLSVSASGCNGATWTMRLMDSGEVSESDPPQRAVKLFLINNEACLTVITQTRSFDLSALQIEDVNEITINIDDFSDPVTYTY